MSLLKIAGKTGSNTAKPFLVTNDGSTVINRPWNVVTNNLASGLEVRDSDAHALDAINIGSYPINSLRIRSTLDQDVAIRLYADSSSDSTTFMTGVEDPLTITIEASNNYAVIVTPQDFPALNYIRYLHLRYQAAEAPTSGTLSVAHVGKC